MRSFSFFSVILSSVLTFCLLTSWAKDKQANDYPMSGKVLAVSSKGAHSYQVETDSRVYLMMCEKTKGIHMGLPECKIDDRPIAAGDTVQFRVDGDWAYMPAAKGAEEGLRILTTELKVIPPLPTQAAPESSNGSNPGGERGMVIGTGMHIRGQKKVGWSTDPSSVKRPVYNAGSPASMAPVMAIPVTGGPPVMMMPTAPSSGAFVTGIPVTGGPPVMGTRVGGPAGGGGGGGPPPWVHLLRVRAGENIYVLECSAKPCEVDNKPIELGDTLVIRAEKKSAYVSSGPESSGKEQKFRILSETEEDKAPDDKDAK
jgi:hypothetical protein